MGFRPTIPHVNHAGNHVNASDSREVSLPPWEVGPPALSRMPASRGNPHRACNLYSPFAGSCSPLSRDHPSRRVCSLAGQDASSASPAAVRSTRASLSPPDYSDRLGRPARTNEDGGSGRGVDDVEAKRARCNLSTRCVLFARCSRRSYRVWLPCQTALKGSAPQTPHREPIDWMFGR